MLYNYDYCLIYFSFLKAWLHKYYSFVSILFFFKNKK